jgi:hypothetical protein
MMCSFQGVKKADELKISQSAHLHFDIGQTWCGQISLRWHHEGF